MHAPIAMESVDRYSVLKTMEGFSERFNSIVGSDDTNASLNPTERLHANPFGDN